MAKFKNKNGGIAEVFTSINIERLRKDKNYTEVIEKPKKEKKNVKENIEEVEKVEPLL